MFMGFLHPVDALGYLYLNRRWQRVRIVECGAFDVRDTGQDLVIGVEKNSAAFRAEVPATVLG
jgi:hypothetical protein